MGAAFIGGEPPVHLNKLVLAADNSVFKRRCVSSIIVEEDEPEAADAPLSLDLWEWASRLPKGSLFRTVLDAAPAATPAEAGLLFSKAARDANSGLDGSLSV